MKIFFCTLEVLSKRTILVDAHRVSYLGLVLVRESPTIPPLENAKLNSRHEVIDFLQIFSFFTDQQSFLNQFQKKKKKQEKENQNSFQNWERTNMHSSVLAPQFNLFLKDKVRIIIQVHCVEQQMKFCLHSNRTFADTCNFVCTKNNIPESQPLSRKGNRAWNRYWKTNWESTLF